MAWQAGINIWDEDEAEVRVVAEYTDGGNVLHREEIVMPAGTPQAKILAEIGRRGRAERARQGRTDPVQHNMIGQQFPIDSL